jgi:DNA-binding LacI/PurR family transcriptional regulator
VAKHLRELIQSQALSPGDALPTFAALRRDFGISQVTYEKAQEQLEREGLVQRQPRRGSFVTHHKQVVAAGSIAISGFGPLARSAAGYWAVLIDGIREVARVEKKTITLIDNPADHTDWSGISGLINASYDECNAPVPFVSLMHRAKNSPSVIADEYKGMRAAVEHLTSLGHRRIAYLPSGYTGEERRAGYYSALLDAGIMPDPQWRRHLSTPNKLVHEFYHSGIETMTHWLADGWAELGCTALVAQNDEAALGIMDALKNAGYSVPRDVSVIGFDGILEDKDADSRITTVVIPLFELGGEAVRQLGFLSKKSTSIAVHILPCTLRIGASTGPAV